MLSWHKLRTLTKKQALFGKPKMCPLQLLYSFVYGVEMSYNLPCLASHPHTPTLERLSHLRLRAALGHASQSGTKYGHERQRLLWRQRNRWGKGVFHGEVKGGAECAVQKTEN